MTSHWIIIIASADLASANTIIGKPMFNQKLSATGEEPVTHYWSGFSESKKDQFYPQLSQLDSFYMSQQGVFDPSLPSRFEVLESQNLKLLKGGHPPWWPPQE